MKGSKFSFNSVDLLYYHLQKTSLRKGGSYIDSPPWLRNKRATINQKNKKDDNCFQYASTVALNYNEIENHPERISNIKPFIDQYKQKEIDIPSYSKDWKRFEQNHKTIVLNILYVPYNTEEIRVACKSEYNFKRDNQLILLMITDVEKGNYLPVKIFPALPKGKTSIIMEIFTVQTVFIHTAQKIDLK